MADKEKYMIKIQGNLIEVTEDVYHEMRMGNIVIRPDEKPWVEYIFRQYITEASLKEISDRLREDGIPFDADNLWNKNEARIYLFPGNTDGTVGR